MVRPPSRVWGLVVQGEDGRSRTAPELHRRAVASPPRDRATSASRIGSTGGVNRLKAGPVGPETERSAGACRPSRRRPQQLCLTGRGTRSHLPPGGKPGDAFGMARQSPRGLSPCPTPPGSPNGRGDRIPTQPGTPAGGKRRGSGRAWFSNRPCPLRDQKPLRAHGPPPTVAGPPGGLELPDQALECQAVHGCGRGSRPQS